MTSEMTFSPSDSGGRQPVANGSAGVDEFVAFRMGDQDFCVDIMCVREIRGWTQATPLPHAPSYVLGVINLRGIVLPVVDLAVRFGLADRQDNARKVIIVTLVGNQLIGLLVDAVSDILAVPRQKIQPTPDVSSELAALFIDGVVALDDRMINVIVLDAVLPSVGGGH